MPFSLAKRYSSVRQHSNQLALPLSAEDQCVQSMSDASPTKWHLAHTSWFFENVVLLPFLPGYKVFHDSFAYLFNSYYEALGPRHPRMQRGLLTRPALSEVWAYREYVDAAMQMLLNNIDALSPQAVAMTELGLNHEQQHQELLLTDALHLLSCNPLLPAYDATFIGPQAASPELAWISCEGGLYTIGKSLDQPGFSFDNETPAHQRYVQDFQIANRLVKCGEYLAFIEDGGYDNADLWLSEGRAQVVQNQWQHPLYWLAPQDPRAPAQHWQVFGLNGLQPLNPDAPVAQLSFYEASAFAQWAGARLPTEFEWETASLHLDIDDMQGQVWQWTRSAYEPYPGFVPASGAVREYNGKFMVGQQVLRGSSFATPADHSRHTYRNFFPSRSSMAVQWIAFSQRQLRPLSMTPSQSEHLSFMQDMQTALSQTPKSISPKYFYDPAGSLLFDRICELPEYYPTRTELSILQIHAVDMARFMGESVDIIEFGAGSLQKIRYLLKAAIKPSRYVPMDISGVHLQEASIELQKEFPTLDIKPLVGLHQSLAAAITTGRGR